MNWPPELPEWLPGWERLPAHFSGHGRLLKEPPRLLVLHSGSVGANVAHYLEHPQRREDAHLRKLRRGGWPTGRAKTVHWPPDDRGHVHRESLILAEGRWWRPVSAHFAATCPEGGFVQQVSLHRQSWHAGGSTQAGRRAVNARSWSIECPGPWYQNPRPEALRDELRVLVSLLHVLSEGVLDQWCRHSEIKAGKHDPGPGVPDTWMDGLGLEHVV